MNPQDHPHFTAYALGELSAEEARELHALLASAPSAAHELEQIEAVTDALRHGAPIPQARLTHEQRHAVLHPSLPRRIQPMQPRKPAPRPRQAFWPMMAVVLKAAAAVVVSGGAFLAGWSLSPVMKDVAEIAATPAKKYPGIKAAGVEATHEVAAEPAKVAAVEPEKMQTAASVQPASAVAAAAAPEKREAMPQAPAAPLKKEVVVVGVPASEPLQAAAPAPAPLAAPVEASTPPRYGFTLPEGRGSFASTSKQATAQFNLQPGLLKPVPAKVKGELLASPPSATTKAEAKPARAPELYIHSWKSEVASCPWNAAHRLLRVVIQLPADQAAVIGADSSFPLQVSFDPATVKQFRMLCERHLAASELRSAGTHVLWYEFQPNGDVGGGRDRQIASVSLPGVRFTSQAVGPFDSNKLEVIDRGYSLQNAREDFVFEASVVGFGMLLRGTENTGALNHALVLDLAKKARGADSSGERSRFIRVVQDAQRMAGL